MLPPQSFSVLQELKNIKSFLEEMKMMDKLHSLYEILGDFLLFMAESLESGFLSFLAFADALLIFNLLIPYHKLCSALISGETSVQTGSLVQSLEEVEKHLRNLSERYEEHLRDIVRDFANSVGRIKESVKQIKDKKDVDIPSVRTLINELIEDIVRRRNMFANYLKTIELGKRLEFILGKAFPIFGDITDIINKYLVF